jgi:hypothetical protein
MVLAGWYRRAANPANGPVPTLPNLTGVRHNLPDAPAVNPPAAIGRIALKRFDRGAAGCRPRTARGPLTPRPLGWNLPPCRSLPASAETNVGGWSSRGTAPHPRRRLPSPSPVVWPTTRRRRCRSISRAWPRSCPRGWAASRSRRPASSSSSPQPSALGSGRRWPGGRSLDVTPRDSRPRWRQSAAAWPCTRSSRWAAGWHRSAWSSPPRRRSSCG